MPPKRAKRTKGAELNKKYLLHDELWEKIKPHIPGERPDKKKPGRSRMDDRKAMQAILYIHRTGIQWNALPRSLGAYSTVHDRFQEWQQAGVFEQLMKAGLLEYDEKKRYRLAVASPRRSHDQSAFRGTSYRPQPY
jgi:putative transposase